MMCQRTEHLAQRIRAHSSLGLVKSRGTQRATRIRAVSACVFNMPLPSSGSLFCHLGSAVYSTAMQGISVERWWHERTVGEGMKMEKTERMMTVEKAGGAGEAKCCPDLLGWSVEAGRAAKSRHVTPDQKHFLTCLIFTHSPRKHPKEKSNVFCLEPETAH